MLDINKNSWLTFIIALKNNSYELDKTLYSIKTECNKISSKVSVIILDCNSTDFPYEVYEKYKICFEILFISEYDNGIYCAWNKSIKLVNSSWLTFFGAGDLLLPNSLVELEKFSMNNNFDIISSKSNIIYSNGKTRISGKKFDFNEFNFKFTTNHSGLMYSTDIFSKYGNFNENYKITSDYDFLLRIGKFVNFGFLDYSVSLYPYGGLSSKSLLPIFEVFHIRKKAKVISSYMNVKLLTKGILAHYYRRFFNFI